jgi:hypothetical protein
MKHQTIAALVALACFAAAPAVAQPQSAAPSSAAPGSSRLSVDKTPIGVIWADPKGKDVLLKQLPPIEMYIDMIKEMTLAQVAPQSGGEIDDAKLKAIQADFDAIK